MTNKVITISRQFGSGGRSIGKAVAEKLGIPYYDKELVDQGRKGERLLARVHRGDRRIRLRHQQLPVQHRRVCPTRWG